MFFAPLLICGRNKHSPHALSPTAKLPKCCEIQQCPGHTEIGLGRGFGVIVMDCRPIGTNPFDWRIETRAVRGSGTELALPSVRLELGIEAETGGRTP